MLFFLFFFFRLLRYSVSLLICLFVFSFAVYFLVRLPNDTHRCFLRTRAANVDV